MTNTLWQILDTDFELRREFWRYCKSVHPEHNCWTWAAGNYLSLDVGNPGELSFPKEMKRGDLNNFFRKYWGGMLKSEGLKFMGMDTDVPEFNKSENYMIAAFCTKELDDFHFVRSHKDGIWDMAYYMDSGEIDYELYPLNTDGIKIKTWEDIQSMGMLQYSRFMGWWLAPISGAGVFLNDAVDIINQKNPAALKNMIHGKEVYDKILEFHNGAAKIKKNAGSIDAAMENFNDIHMDAKAHIHETSQKTGQPIYRDWPSIKRECSKILRNNMIRPIRQRFAEISMRKVREP